MSASLFPHLLAPLALGFVTLRNRSVMGAQLLSQQKAWQLYDRLRGDERIQYLDEPLAVEPRFRRSTQGRLPAHKNWSDAYLAAVAGEAGFAVATFDRDFRRFAIETHFLG